MRLVEQGLLEARNDGVWELTSRGRQSLLSIDTSKATWRYKELARREALWASLVGRSSASLVQPSLLRSIGIYAGARGIYVDVERTRSEYSPAGVALSFLHLGERYDNELSDGGVVYHFPKTKRPGRDRAEIEATEAAFALGLPVFVIAVASGSYKHRHVLRSFVEDIDPRSGTALITFIGDSELPPAPPIEDGSAFDLVEMAATERWSWPHQARFSFDVMRRYGPACAVCGLTVSEALEAAHLRPKSKMGSDDPRNGLPLCRNHHRMFDAFLWAVDPRNLSVNIHRAYSAEVLGITMSDLTHLPALPHQDAMRDAWAAWLAHQNTPIPAADIRAT